MFLIGITIFTVAGTSVSSHLHVLGRSGIHVVGQGSRVKNSQIPFSVCLVLTLSLLIFLQMSSKRECHLPCLFFNTMNSYLFHPSCPSLILESFIIYNEKWDDGIDSYMQIFIRIRLLSLRRRKMRHLRVSSQKLLRTL